ncbi:MAG: topoisomerase DNA-binding C4 zinc finger domain-containing protein [Dehalococcoidia bacterium]
MEYLIPIVVGSLIVYALLYWAFNCVAGMLRNKAARDALAGFNFNKEKKKIKSIGSRYVSEEYRCPRCNGMLVKRIGRYGEFFGCNHYPDCRYTRSIQ